MSPDLAVSPQAGAVLPHTGNRSRWHFFSAATIDISLPS